MEHLDMRKKVTIMIAIMSVMLFAALNMTIVATSLPKIVADIGGMEYFNWVFTIYMLTSSVTAILVGKLSDIYGRKIFILTGICIFMIGAVLSGFSSHIYQLIIFRGLQGFGGGMIMSSAFTTIGDLFAPRERGRWQGLMGGVFGLSSLFGPTLGGYIVDHMHWSWVFWIFLPIGIIAFFMILRLYPQAEPKEKEKIDFLGSFILTLFILSLLLGFSWAGTEYAWGSYQIIGLFTLSLLSLISFIMVEKRVKSPVVPLHLFSNSVVSVSNTISFLAGMAMFGVIMYVPFYVQGVLGRSATTSGLIEMVMTIAMVSCSALAGQLITKTGKYKIIALLGFGIMATGIYLNTSLTPDTTIPVLIFNLIVTGIGLGLTMPIFTLTVQNAVAHKYLGVGTATSQLCRQLGGTVGVAIMGYMMSSRIIDRLNKTDVTMPSSAVAGELDMQNPQILMDAAALEGIRQRLAEQMRPAFDQLIDTLKVALSDALTFVFLFSAIIVTVAFLLTLFLKEIPLRTSNQDPSGTTDQKEREQTYSEQPETVTHANG
ncbi:MDR family MFS transporter [Caldalkalibacillus salinus]|uniref:MDR family MFS transporter n=1 Tax=Caldalkalibacillus salinus TaxID=2803787 RepID=UPI0019209346|nr:MDR family MFS transporter [Caldalkalibacillus salinus]